MRSHQVHQWNYLPVGVHRVTLTPSGANRRRRAGYPATIALAGTSRVTTLPAPIRAFSPMVILARIVAPDPIEAPFLTSVGSTCQSFCVCNSPLGVVARG